MAYVLAIQAHLLLPIQFPSSPQLPGLASAIPSVLNALICVPFIPSFGPAPLSGTRLDPTIKMPLTLPHVPSRLLDRMNVKLFLSVSSLHLQDEISEACFIFFF